MNNINFGNVPFIGLYDGYERYLPTANDDSLTLLTKMRKLLALYHDVYGQVNKLTEDWNKFTEWLNSCGFTKHMINILNEWLKTGSLEEVIKKDLNFEYTINKMNERIDELLLLFSEADFYSKKEIDDLFKLSKAESYITEPYYQDKVRPIFYQTIDDFKSRFDNVKDGRFNFAFFTDAHYSPNDSYWGNIGDATKSITHLYNIGLFSSQLKFISCGGDNVDSSDPISKANSYSYNNHFVTTALTLFNCPTFFGIGNHDDNNIGGLEMRFSPYNKQRKTQLENIVTDEEFKYLYRQKDCLFGEMRNNESNYMYKDFNEDKIRYIWLDVYDNDMSVNEDGLLKYPRNTHSMISKSQLKWFIQNALNLPDENWQVIIGLHCPIDNTIQKNTNTCINHDKVLEIINAFKNGGSGSLAFSETDRCDYVSYNFEPSNLICVINGHLHRDEFVCKDNVNYVSVDCSLGGAHQTKYYDTPMEDSWKTFCVDSVNRKVNIVSFGRGNDREFTY